VGGAWQASVNPKAETVEELKGRRRTLHLGMFKLGREDLVLALQAALDDYAVPAYPPSCRLLLHPAFRLIWLILIAPLFSRS
jgi:hypothetical protein